MEFQAINLLIKKENTEQALTVFSQAHAAQENPLGISSFKFEAH